MRPTPPPRSGSSGRPPIFESVGRRLRLVLSRQPADPVVDAETVDVTPPLPPEIEFVGFAEDCLLMGHIRMDAKRLTDLLNDHDEYQLVDVHVEGIADERAVQTKEIVVARDELLLVQAVGPRGDRSRRVRTRQHPLAMQVGPYEVRGYLHALPGSDPVTAFRHRKTMVPLTEAVVEYDCFAGRQRRRVSTLVVNRRQVSWVAESVGEEMEMLDMPVKADGGRLTKDFTGHVLGGSK